MKNITQITLLSLLFPLFLSAQNYEKTVVMGYKTEKIIIAR